MMHLSSSDQLIFDLNQRILQDYNICLSQDACILDFGCGSGRHLEEYLQHGYLNSYGYDVRDYAVKENEETVSRLRFSPDGRLPFEENTFDFVFSTQVLEHILDYDRALSEIKRVLKAGGVSLHYFPSRCRPIEPHIKVPFGGVFHSKA